MGWSVALDGRDRRTARFARLVALVLFAAPLGGCESLSSLVWWNKEDPVLEEPADKLYNEGLFLLNDRKDIKAAAKRFDEVERQHPYSDWARKSLLMSAYAFYNSGDYDSCIGAPTRYVTLHPGSADPAYG